MGSDPTKRSARDLFQQTLRLDYLGATLVAAAVTCIVLALQWGGNTKPWNDKDVIIVSNLENLECQSDYSLVSVFCLLGSVHPRFHRMGDIPW